MNTEIDAVVESTIQTEQDIAQYRADQLDQDQQRRSTIDELQHRLASTLEITRNLDAQNTMHQESVSQIGKKVYTFFFNFKDITDLKTKGSHTYNFRLPSSVVNDKYFANDILNTIMTSRW